jgi:peroxiredoxin
MSALTTGKSAPAISLTTTSGQKVTLADALLKGPVLAAFFKVNCPTCQFTLPFLQRIYEKYGAKHFTLWGISQNDAADSREFNQEFGIRFPILLDDAGFPVSNRYGLTNVPSLFLIAADGTIQVSSVGFAKADIEQIGAEAARASSMAAAPVFKPGEVVPQYKPG